MNYGTSVTLLSKSVDGNLAELLFFYEGLAEIRVLVF